jgi:hypothetical protein
MPAGAWGRVALDDFDAVASVNTVFTERYTQIGRGRAAVRAAVATTRRMQIVFASRSPGVRIQGASLGATSLLAIPIESPALHIQGVPCAPGTLAYVPPAHGYEILSALPHRILAVAVDPTASTPWLARGGVPHAEELLRALLPVEGSRDRPAGRADLGTLARRCDTAEGAAAPRRGIHPRVARGAHPDRRHLLRGQRFHPRASQCLQAGLGIPPKTYQKALRLASVRKELLAGRPGTTVSATAVKWGFFQFGYFAMDYRRMFGERHDADGAGRGTAGEMSTPASSGAIIGLRHLRPRCSETRWRVAGTARPTDDRSSATGSCAPG